MSSATGSARPPRVVGLLLAAGSGTRMGGPKALMEAITGEPWVVSASRALRAGGCEEVYVASGAAHDQVSTVLKPADGEVIFVPNWFEGLGTTLRTCLTAIEGSASDAEAVMLHLVDLPDVGADVIRRVISLVAPDVLARATFSGRPGHPVLVGRDHWANVIAGLRENQGANGYLSRSEVIGVECADLACGMDADSPKDLERLQSTLSVAGTSS